MFRVSDTYKGIFAPPIARHSKRGAVPMVSGITTHPATPRLFLIARQELSPSIAASSFKRLTASRMVSSA
jgi:hypothetical protein